MCNVISVTACRRTSIPAPHRVHTHPHSQHLVFPPCGQATALLAGRCTHHNCTDTQCQAPSPSPTPSPALDKASHHAKGPSSRTTSSLAIAMGTGLGGPVCIALLAIMGLYMWRRAGGRRKAQRATHDSTGVQEVHEAHHAQVQVLQDVLSTKTEAGA